MHYLYGKAVQPVPLPVARAGSARGKVLRCQSVCLLRWGAGVNGISWPMARIAFDGFQSIKSDRLDHEPKGTQIAQLKGWIHGTLSFGRLTYNLLIPLH